MARRMYEEFDIPEDMLNRASDKDLLAQLMLHAGQLYNISGLVFQGNEKTFLVMFPTASELEAEWNDDRTVMGQIWVAYLEGIFNPTVPELQAIIKRTDSPLIFEQDEIGILKSIIRKSQRVISGAVQQQIWHRDGFQCMYCGQGIPKVQLTVDHFVPVERGGKDEPSNYLSACRQCNKNKGNQDPEQYCWDHNLDYSGLQLYLQGRASKNFILHLT